MLLVVPLGRFRSVQTDGFSQVPGGFTAHVDRHRRSRSWLEAWRVRHYPEPQTRGGQGRLQRHLEAEVLVDRHVARGEGEQPAGISLRIGAGGHLAHEGAADALSVVSRLDADNRATGRQRDAARTVSGLRPRRPLDHPEPVCGELRGRSQDRPARCPESFARTRTLRI
jgi:hypothetical protein